MIKIVPKIPLGPYPQPALCGHAGNAPISNKIKITIKTVPNMTTPQKMSSIEYALIIYHIRIVESLRQQNI